MRKLAYYALATIWAALPILVSLPIISAIANSSLVFEHQLVAIIPVWFSWVTWYAFWFWDEPKKINK